MLEACQITLKIKGIERGYAIKCEFFKWALIGLFLFNFFPFKQRYRKNASCVGFQTWIVCVEGEHADHSTNTTTAQHFLYPSTPLLPNKRNLLYSSDVVCGPNRLKFAWRHQRVKRLSILFASLRWRRQWRQRRRRRRQEMWPFIEHKGNEFSQQKRRIFCRHQIFKCWLATTKFRLLKGRTTAEITISN